MAQWPEGHRVKQQKHGNERDAAERGRGGEGAGTEALNQAPQGEAQ